MPIRKKKISDLTLADSLKGLYTIGYKVVGGVKTSVKVGLEYIQVAYEDVVKATQDAISAAKTALTAASTADTSREAIEANELERESNESARKTSEQERAAAENQRATAETGRDNAEKARVTEFSKIKTDAEKATGDAISATGKTNEATQNANVATNAANAATAAANQAAIEANKSTENADAKAQAAQNAADNANDTAEHPTYIGQDHYVYKWNKTTSSYDKTDIYTKGDAFSIKKVYASVAELEADADNAGIAEGDFVLVNTGDVENPDNAKLYVKAKSDAGVYSYEFLVDMSGAIGFTGKTPQFSMGTISTLEAGSSATATVSEDGVDSDGNPKYKINFAIPRGNPGAPFNPVGQYDTLELLQAAIPDGSGVNGMIAVGTEAPYEYYAWLNGGWVNQGKVAGGGSGNVVVIPLAVSYLSNESSSAEIFNAFGGKDAFMDICKKLYDNDDTVCVMRGIENDYKMGYTISISNTSYIDDNNASMQIAISAANASNVYMFFVNDGLATMIFTPFSLLTDSPSDGNTYGRKNQDWVEVPEKSDVLTKTNTTEYTPTGDYQPATKKFVDTSLSDNRGIGYMMTKTVIDATGLDENTWYPVVIPLGRIYTLRIEVISSTYGSGTPSWSTQVGGFSVRKIWEVNGLEWGIHPSINRQIFVSDYKWAITDPVRGIGQMTNSGNEYVYVRGGGIYTFLISHNRVPVLHTETYKVSSESVSPTTEEPALIVANMPTKEYVDNMNYGKVINGSAEILNNCNLTGAEAETKIITLFGSLDAFKNCIKDMFENHVRYFYTWENNIVDICGVVWMSTDKNNYELYFTFNYPDLTHFSNKRIVIRYTVSSSTPTTIIIQDISTDDKLKTMFADISQSPEQDLNNINGSGIMYTPQNIYATPERNYPIQEAGGLFYSRGVYTTSNQIYGTYSTNRWFARGGGNTVPTSWREFAFKDDIYKGTVSSGSIDNITTAGEYVISPDVTDDPFTSWCWLKIMGGSDIVQIVINMLDLRIAIRGRVNGNWRSWKLITPVDI